MTSENGDVAARVSVCILCYNQKNMIGRIIEATLQQTHQANEILVVDDGSNDGSEEVIRSYPGVKLLQHAQNQGRAAARNTLLQAAQENIIVYLDGDTIPDAHLLQSLLPEYAQPEVGAVGSHAVEQNIKTVADRWRERHGSPLNTERIEDATAVFGAGFSCRRTVATELGGFRLGGEEVDMCLRLHKAGYRIVYTPAARVYHLRSDTLPELLHTIYRWWFGGSIALARNGQASFLAQMQEILGLSFKRFLRDCLVEREFAIAFINLLLLPVQIKALLDGRNFLRSGLSHQPGLSGL